METGSKLKISLSPSSLNLFLECPCCFWLEKAGNLKRPRGIFPSLPGGMDRVIKTYFDSYRAQGSLPPELRVEAFQGIQLYPDQRKLDLWREWRTGLRYRDADESAFFGAVDDLLVKDGAHIPFDYKTKGSPTTADDAVKYYQNQMDGYALLLKENDMPVAGYGFLLYFSPKTVGEKGSVAFHIQAIRLEVDPERVRQTFRRAVAVLRDRMPPSAPSCEYCGWLRQARNGTR